MKKYEGKEVYDVTVELSWRSTNKTVNCILVCEKSSNVKYSKGCMLNVIVIANNKLAVTGNTKDNIESVLSIEKNEYDKWQDDVDQLYNNAHRVIVKLAGIGGVIGYY